MDRRPGDRFDCAIGTQHIHAGHDVDFAGDKPRGDDQGQSISLKSGCLCSVPSAEFSDTKVLNVMTRSSGPNNEVHFNYCYSRSKEVISDNSRMNHSF